MRILNLTNLFISESFKDLLQISNSGEVYNGLGEFVSSLNVQFITASFYGTASYSNTSDVYNVKYRVTQPTLNPAPSSYYIEQSIGTFGQSGKCAGIGKAYWFGSTNAFNFSGLSSGSTIGVKIGNEVVALFTIGAGTWPYDSNIAGNYWVTLALQNAEALQAITGSILKTITGSNAVNFFVSGTSPGFSLNTTASDFFELVIEYVISQ